MKKNSPLPRLSRVEFFRLNEGELTAALAPAFARRADVQPDAKLTADQRAVVVWSRQSLDVPNGGFTQFFYNHGGDSGVKELARLLDSLDCAEGRRPAPRRGRGLPKAQARESKSYTNTRTANRELSEGTNVKLTSPTDRTQSGGLAGGDSSSAADRSLAWSMILRVCSIIF